MENESTQYMSNEATQIDEKTVPVQDEKTMPAMQEEKTMPATAEQKATPAAPAAAKKPAPAPAAKTGSDTAARAGIAAAAFGAGVGATVLASAGLPDKSADNKVDNDDFFDDEDESENEMAGTISDETGRTIADIMEQDPDGYISSDDSDFDSDSDSGSDSHSNSDSDSDEISVVRSNVPSWSDGTVDVATNVDDSMTFGEAFAAARAEVGPGGAFEWHGKVYGTFYKNEWNNMTADEKAEYESHFDWSRSHHHDTADDEIPVEHQKSHIANNDDNSDDNDDNDDDEINVIGGEEDLPVVEVLGVGYDEDLDANVGVVSVDGVEAVLLDVDTDNTFDYLLVDENNDGEYSDDEIYDISEEDVTIGDLEELSVMPDDVDIADDADMSM